MPAVLEFEHITKEYSAGIFPRRRIRALDNFSLQVERGEIFGFLGPNGAGKTTAIHLALGFMRASSGSGSMLGRPFGHAPTRARVGFVAENVALYHRRAGALVRFYGGLNGLSPQAVSKAAHNALELVDMSGEADRNVGKFSRGMLQRVALAQALVNDPELLILDEPTSALDPLGRVAVRELLLQARRAGKTIFLSSHLLSEVEQICDRVGILMRGRLVRLGTPAELLEEQNRWTIKARGINPARHLACVRDGELFTFEATAASQRIIIERIWADAGEVVSVEPVRRSLEDLFVTLAAESEKEAAK